MAVQLKNKNGKTVTLLNPAEKGEKFAKELKGGFKRTNSGQDNHYDKHVLRLLNEYLFYSYLFYIDQN